METKPFVEKCKNHLGPFGLLYYNFGVPEEAVPANPLDRQLSDLPGVGGDRASQLARLKCHTLCDIFLHRPRRHEDRRKIQPIRELSKEEQYKEINEFNETQKFNHSYYRERF